MLNRSQPDSVEVELIRSLFDAFVPSLIMSVGFITAGSLIVARTGDPILLALLLCGVAASMARLLVAHALTPAARKPDLSLERARRLQRRFALPYYAFGTLLGLFGLRAFLLPDADVHMLTICMIVGYCAGVATGMGLRPRIAIPSMIAALVPAILAALAADDMLYWATGLLGAAFLYGGIYSLRGRHARAIKDIGLSLTFANLARRDALTALPNRIALREWYDEHASFANTQGMVAVHYIDLNGFKPINDNYGHPVGDELLTAVGKRIARAIRETDMAARLGGDEFAVVQYGISGAREAEQLATRLSEAIARPFRIGNRTIRISTGLGFVVAHAGSTELEQLLSLADQALYASKRTGDAVMHHESVTPPLARAVA